MEVKYTSDGRKVVILGRLNAQEFIVQEVFVTEDGAEIPSGENFVVKSLHDKPAKSWKQEEAEKIDKRYEEHKREHDARMNRLSKAMELASVKIEALNYLSKDHDIDELETLRLFVAGKITHLVKVGWSPNIVPYDDALPQREEYGRYEHLRLIGLFGDTKGNLSWRINAYRDGSGSWDTISPATSYEDACRILQEALNAKVAEWRDPAKVKRQEHGEYFTDWLKVPVTMPPDLLAWNAKARELKREKRRAELKAELAKLEAQG